MRTKRHHSEGVLVAKSKIVTHTACGKRGYTTRKVAAQFAARSRKASGEPIEPYHCTSCHLFHLGHPPGWRFAQHKRQTQAS